METPAFPSSLCQDQVFAVNAAKKLSDKTTNYPQHLDDDKIHHKKIYAVAGSTTEVVRGS